MTRASIVKPAQRNRAMMEDRSTRSAVASDEIDNLARLFANLAIAAGALAMEVLDNSSIEFAPQERCVAGDGGRRAHRSLFAPRTRTIIAWRALFGRRERCAHQGARRRRGLCIDSIRSTARASFSPAALISQSMWRWQKGERRASAPSMRRRKGAFGLPARAAMRLKRSRADLCRLRRIGACFERGRGPETDWSR